ncbi:pyridoxal-phosphate dependent enzyme [Lysinibacter cavernae]|uniref:Threonine synthase n=1 Tax=Lysinibacter cavernae TaxID=1640652 RepID=A0A7X5R3E6_9MICO|nr:pyridoxal-phosphate dependent enzyme [Lysinibacter cavernae]NIH54807.1 threonine synthase [Lysinibacter cavernae]
MSTCQSCGAVADAGVGRCHSCGGVCLRREPWQADARLAPSTTPLLTSRIPYLHGAKLKVEGAQPSGSFKDRVMAVLVAEAVAAGATGAVVASSGNAAVAAASHCARAGLPLLVLVPERVPAPIVSLVALRGATMIRVGDGPAAVHDLAHRLSNEFGLPNLASTFGASGCEWACRGIGHELFGQLGDAPVSAIAAAVSVGPVLLGAATGYQEAGGSPVRMIAGQAAGCSPIARAFADGGSVQPWADEVDTKATSIADRLTGYAPEATFFLERVLASGGYVGAAADRALAAIRSDLATYDGLDVELSSCAAIAALVQSGQAGPDAVAILTGAGIRETLAPGAPAAASGSLADFCSMAQLGADSEERVTQWIAEYRS